VLCNVYCQRYTVGPGGVSSEGSSILGNPFWDLAYEAVVEPAIRQAAQTAEDCTGRGSWLSCGIAAATAAVSGGAAAVTRRGAARGGPGFAAGTTRLDLDVAVNPRAPGALPLTGRPIGRASHNRALQTDIDNLPTGVADIRVNQQQVNAAGQRVGINRPDLQYTVGGQRYYIEYEGPANPRGASHTARIGANDPGAVVIVRLVP